MGGNFALAAPDPRRRSPRCATPTDRAGSTKIKPQHLDARRAALSTALLGRTERDIQNVASRRQVSRTR